MMTSNGEPLNSADQAFIQELYYSNSKLLSICAQRMGFRAEVAEDYVQEVFLIAMKRIDVIKSCKNPQAYLIKVLKNVVGYNLRCAQYASRMMKKLKDQRSNAQVNGVYQEELDLETLYHGAISEEEFAEAMVGIRDFVDMGDFANAEEILSQMENFTIGSEFAVKYAEVRRLVSTVDRNALLEYLKNN